MSRLSFDVLIALGRRFFFRRLFSWAPTKEVINAKTQDEPERLSEDVAARVEAAQVESTSTSTAGTEEVEQ